MSEPIKPATVPSVDDVVHTPGPWKVPRRFDIYQDLGPNVGGTYIGTTAGNRVLPESVARVDEANARLMAAAPEMLDALREANEFLADLAKRGRVKDAPEGLNDWCRVQSKVSDAIRATQVV